MIHLCGWCEDQTKSANTWTSIAALTDPALYTSGDDLRVPQGMERVVMLATRREGATNVADRSRITSPYLLRRQPFQIAPIAAGGDWGGPNRVVDMFGSPLMLRAQENVRAQIYGAAEGSNARTTTLMWLADADPQPLRGDYMSVLATAAGTAAGDALTWSNKALTFAEELPFGDYRIGGMRCVGGNVIAVRLALPGYTWRPGCVSDDANSLGTHALRFGRAGELGRFNTNQPPSIDVLSFAAANAVVVLDLLPM